jgi:hypothetical protein
MYHVTATDLCTLEGRAHGSNYRFAYSAMACFRMGMSGVASFQTAMSFWLRILRFRFLQEHYIRIGVAAQYAKIFAIRRPVN